MTMQVSEAKANQIYTAEELEKMLNDVYQHQKLPEHFEVVEGKIVEIAPLGENEAYTIANIIVILGGYLRGKKLGKLATSKLAFRLKDVPLTLRVANVAFVSRKRVNEKSQRKNSFEGAPDLAIEVVSPGNSASEMENKVAEYLEAGSKLVWLVYPEREVIHVYKAGEVVTAQILKSSDIITGEDVIAGFACQVSEFFEED